MPHFCTVKTAALYVICKLNDDNNDDDGGGDDPDAEHGYDDAGMLTRPQSTRPRPRPRPNIPPCDDAVYVRSVHGRTPGEDLWLCS